MTRGTPAAGLKHTHSHALSRYTGRSNFHLQKRKDAQSGGGFHTKKRRYNWSTKALRRNTTGTGRMRCLSTSLEERRTAGEAALKPPRRSRHEHVERHSLLIA